VPRAAAAAAAIFALSGPPSGATWVETWTGIELVLLPAGRFTMGSPPAEAGREAQETAHEVVLSRAFYLGRTEVTQAQWERVMGPHPSSFPGCPACPVESVSARDVAEFLDRIERRTGERLRLPTEAEWEYACRAGTTTAYSTGDTLTTAQANFDDAPGDAVPSARDRRRPLPVASYPPNPWGLHDLHGNVWEWTADPHCPYPEGPLADPVARCDSPLRVIRGGSWAFAADSARCALRYTHRPGDSGPSLGFRLARSSDRGGP
jgi:formylglycine-generating enzyme required for sulfatase activity